jgi:hypothetical protein
MGVLDLILRTASRVKHLFRGRSKEKTTEVGSGYPLW